MPQDMLEAVRRALEGVFTVEREIGRGGAARVYLARTPAGAAVALKVLHPELRVSLAADRFLREVRLTARLDHPNIARLLDSGERDWAVWYSMPYEEGPTLREALDRVRRLPPEDVERLARDLLAGLAHAHGLGIIHRDVKPDNILVTRTRAILVDFGIARAFEESADTRITRSGVTIGTCHYMSPEQIRADAVLDGRSDLYSLGTVLFECAAGHGPFPHLPEGIALQKHLAEPAPPVHRFRPELPAALAMAIDRALAKDPADRWANAQAMREALAAAVPA